MQSLRTSTVFVAVLLCAGLAPAQSLLTSQGQVIVYSGQDNTPTGDVAPGLLSGERFGGSSGPASGVMDDAGRVLFRAQIADAAGVGLAGYLGRGYFLGDSRGNIVKLFRGGDPEPSGTITGATIQTSGGASTLTSTPRIASNGLILFGSNFWDVAGGTIATANDSAIFVGTPGNWQILVREGSVAPNCGGATFSSDFGGISHALSALNNAGQTVFQSNIAGPNVGANNIAWFGGSVGNVQLILRKGDLGPNGEVITSVGFATQMNASGQALFEVSYVAGTGTPAVTTANDKAIWFYTPGLPATEILREGSPSPIPGTFFASPSLSAVSMFNAAGQALIGVDLTGAITVGADDKAVFLASSSGTSLVVRRGDAAPGIPGASFNTVGIFNMCLTDGGIVAITSTVMNGGVTTSNDSGLWTGTAGNLTLLAREGDVAPGSGGQLFGAFSGNLLLNTAGQVLFSNALSGGGNAQSIYSRDPVLGVQPVFFPSESLEVQPGVFKALSASIGGAQTTNGGSRPLNFANDGTVTYRTSFSDGSFAIVKIRTGSLTALPKKISDAAGGIQKLYLQAGSAHAGELYAIAGSASGTNPGTTIGAFTVPLNMDGYTDFTLAFANTGPYANTFGNLDASGRAVATITVPPATGLSGVIVHHAYGVLDTFGNLVFASEAASLEVIP